LESPMLRVAFSDIIFKGRGFWGYSNVVPLLLDIFKKVSVKLYAF